MSKLYTEEQMIQAYESGRGLTHEEVMEQFVPIQLPSDEAIDDGALETFLNDSKRFGFIEGAKWMRDKIIGEQDNE